MTGKMKKYTVLWLAAILWILLTMAGCQNEAKESAHSGEEAVWEDTAREVSSAERTMEVTFLDVGQADCIFIQAEGHYMLVDAGKNEDGDAIVSFLREKGVDRLDYVIGTHPHEDHIGGLDVVIRALPIGAVILPDKIHTSQTFEDVLEAVEEKELEITLARPGDTYTLGGGSFTILSPNKDYGDTLNNWSVGIRLVNGSNSFLMTGDGEQEAEEDILSTGLTLKSDVLKAGHHGSDTSNSSRFLDAVQPQYAVISCGQDNQYGHPDLSVLETFRDRGISVFRTDEQGTVTAVSDGSSITWNLEPSRSMEAGVQQTETDSEDTEPVNQDNLQKDTEEAADTIQGEEEEIVYITETGEKYHRTGCQYLKNSAREIAREEAEARGLTPCGKCHP
ncbi:ComEC/Rec2 family competence protein [Lactonifactor longoviformis]|uniref:ComEC/Rec2 family competence protein n=1 Tax=Lactonifactor longoviformis TaxID=341220 RepID=UPI0036F1FC3A